MAFQVLRADELDWRVTNPLGVANANLTSAFGFSGFTARVWRLDAGQAMPRHRHRFQTELYVLLEGRGRLRVEGTLLELAPLSAVLVDPDSLRQVFNDTDAATTWLIVGAPPEHFAISDELYAAEHRHLYPDGITDLPPELRARGGGTRRPPGDSRRSRPVAYDEQLASRMRALLAADPDVTEARMFGGVAYLVRGNMAISASGQGGALVRVDPDESDALVAATRAEEAVMRGRPMRGWLRVTADDLEVTGVLERWVEIGVAYARTLPAKS